MIHGIINKLTTEKLSVGNLKTKDLQQGIKLYIEGLALLLLS